MNPNRILIYLTAVFFMALGTTPALSQDGKMPLTTSSGKARQAYLEGMHYLDRSQPESARELFEKAVKLDPDFIMAYDGLRNSSPNFKVARETFQKIQEMSGRVQVSDGERLYLESVFAAFDGDRDGQQQKLQQLAKIYPKDERVQYRLGVSYFRADDAEAVRLLRQAQRINPEFVPVYNIMGYSLIALGKDKEAERAFKKAIDLDPENPNAYDSYAELLLKHGRFSESIASYDKALEHEPMFPSAQIGVAANLLLQGKHEAARKRLQSLFDIAPHDGIRCGIHWAMAVTYADEKNLEKSVGELRKNYELSRKNDDLAAVALDLNNLAAVLVEAGKYGDAQAKLDQSLQTNLDDPDQNDRGRAFAKAFHAYGSGIIAAKNHDFDTAGKKSAELEELAETLDANFMTQNMHELRGVIALEKKQFDTALAELQQANATEAYNMYRIGLAYEGLGNAEQARKMFSYVVTYHSPLNFNYSFVRHKAAEKMEHAGS